MRCHCAPPAFNRKRPTLSSAQPTITVADTLLEPSVHLHLRLGGEIRTRTNRECSSDYAQCCSAV